jgi:uncharacterized RDD family membrane protein YckC
VVSVAQKNTTIGKRILGLSIQKTDKTKITIRSSISREVINLINIFSCFILFFCIPINKGSGYIKQISNNYYNNGLYQLFNGIILFICIVDIIKAIVSRKRITVHDQLAETVVIKAKKINKLGTLIGVIVYLILSIMCYYYYLEVIS